MVDVDWVVGRADSSVVLATLEMVVIAVLG
jgi:hypothetical protein